MPVITFENALNATSDQKRHLLLGNGFSIALFADRFRYQSLLQMADFSDFPAARQSFEALETADFEMVIEALRQMAVLAPLYDVDQHSQDRISSDAEALKDLLVEAVAGRHPEAPSEISEEQYRACRKFLSHFAGDSRAGRPDRRGQIYTLNYDLLLYWTLLHDQIAKWNPDNPLSVEVEHLEQIRHDDGFRAPPDDWDAPYVSWEGEAVHSQCIFFLHGALHLFDHGFELRKVCWERGGGKRLVEQIRGALDQNSFPLFVSEGTSESKLDKIRHSGYLHKGLRSFSEICRKDGNSLFIFGHSLANNDDHILDFIVRGKIRSVYVSMFGGEDSAENVALVQKAERMIRQRGEVFPLEIHFYDAQSAQVWG